MWPQGGCVMVAAVEVCAWGAGEVGLAEWDSPGAIQYAASSLKGRTPSSGGCSLSGCTSGAMGADTCPPWAPTWTSLRSPAPHETSRSMPAAWGGAWAGAEGVVGRAEATSTMEQSDGQEPGGKLVPGGRDGAGSAARMGGSAGCTVRFVLLRARCMLVVDGCMDARGCDR